MLTELRGKGGNLCSQAKSGEIRCPLIVRPTSEDVITSHIFQSLGYLNARWWLPDLLNAGLGANRFRRQFLRDLKIRLWQNQPCYPKELLPWYEGSTQVDALISWENPPTTIYIEAKYGSSLSTSVAGDDGRSGYPSDQLIRNIRVGLLQGTSPRGAIPRRAELTEGHPPFGSAHRTPPGSIRRRDRLRRHPIHPDQSSPVDDCPGTSGGRGPDGVP